MLVSEPPHQGRQLKAYQRNLIYNVCLPRRLMDAVSALYMPLMGIVSILATLIYALF